MSSFCNNFYYGKAGKADFTPDQLPKNRVELFFSTLRVRFGGLFGLSLLYSLFCIPALIWSYINVQMLFYAENPLNYMTTYLLIMIPCLGICGIGAPGLMYILRNWARDQHSFTLSDFKDAVKGNWKQGLAVGLINGLSLFLMWISYSFYGQMAATSSLIFVIPQAMVIIAGCVWWMMNMIIYTMMVTYDMKFSQLVRNSAIMVVARLPLSIGIWLLSLLIPVLIALLAPMGPFFTMLYLMVLGYALNGFLYASYANSCFDKFLNPRIEGAQVNMGLRDPSLDDGLNDDDDLDENDLTKEK